MTSDEVTLQPDKLYYIRTDGTIFEAISPENQESSSGVLFQGNEYLIVDQIGKTIKLKKIGKLKPCSVKE